jgi:hypothetical protein
VLDKAGDTLRPLDVRQVNRGPYSSSYSGPRPGDNRFVVFPYSPEAARIDPHVVITHWLPGVEARLAEEGVQ